MAQVTETLVDATGAPLAGRRVRAWLVPVGYDTTGGSRRTVASVEQPAVTTTDASGVWTLDLVPNADIEVPTGSYYKVERPGGTVSIVVTSGGPHQLADLLVDSPTAPDASALAAHVVTSGLTGGHLPVAGDPGDVLTTVDGTTWTSQPAGAASHPNLAAHDALGLATQAELDAGLAGKAGTGHNHDGTYSAAAHNHSGVYDPAGTSSTHAAASDHPNLHSTGTPANLGVAGRGTGTQAARDDHVHAMPSASDVGAATSGHNHDASYSASGHAHSGVYDPAGTAATAVAAHEADTTSVHGIADTSTLYRSGGTDVAVADGGTGASDAATARTNLGVPSDPAAGTAGMRTLGTGATQAAAGDDSRLSDARTPTDGSVTTAKIVDGAVTLSKVAQVATARFLGRVTAGTGVVEEMTAAQARTVIGPSGTADSTTYLRGDGTWATPAGGGSVATDGLWDAKGDLAVATADNTAARLAAGASDGMVLQRRAAEATGLLWGLPVLRGRWKTGHYYSAFTTGTTNGLTLTDQRLYVIPFVVGVTRSFDRISLHVSTAGAGSVVRLGIYNDDGTGYPGTVLLDAGTIDSSSTGAKEITISQTLTPGLWWLAAVQQGGTSPAVRGVTGTIPAASDTSNPNSTLDPAYRMEGVSGALTTFSTTVTTIVSAPRVFLRAASS